jgi:hypothetical protein
MTKTEAKRLLPQTVVKWEGEPTALGTVRASNPHDGVYVDWSDGHRGWISFDRVDKLQIW